MTSDSLSTAEKIRCLVAATPGSTTAEIAGRLGIWRGVALRALETLTCAGVVERRAGSSQRRGRRPAPTWFPASNSDPPTDHFPLTAEVLAVVDRHGRATIDEVVFELTGRHAKARTRAVVHRMLQDGTIDAVNGSIGRPEAVNKRTTFGKALIALQTLTRPFVRAEAVLVLDWMPVSYVDTILLRACESGYLVKEGHHFRNVVRGVIRRPTKKDVIGVFSKDAPISLAQIRARMTGFNTRPISNIVMELLGRGELVRVARGAYALPGTSRASGELTIRGRVAALLKANPDREWSGPEVARELAIDNIVDAGQTLCRLSEQGRIIRTSRGIYRHARRRRALIEPPRLNIRPGKIEAPRAAAAKLVHSALLAASGVALTVGIHRDTKLSAASFRSGLNFLVDAGRVCIVRKYVVSLVPAARLDVTATPPSLRVLAAALAHGSINAAIDDGGLHRGDVENRSIRSLLKWKLLIESEGDVCPNSFPHVAALRKIVRSIGFGSLTPTERRAFAFILRNPGLRKTDIAAGVGIGRGVANRAVDAVLGKGLLKCSEGRYWADRSSSAGRLPSGRGRPRLLTLDQAPAR